MDFYGYLSLLIGFAMAVLGYEYDIFLLIPLGVILIIAGAVLIIKDKIDARRDKKAKQEALKATAIHREGDEEFNRKAKRYLLQFRLCFVGMGATVVLIMVLTSYDMINGFVLIGAGAAIFGLFCLAGRINKKIGGLKDREILQNVLENHFTEVEILPNTIHEDLVRGFNAGLPHFDRMDSYNLIKAKYNGLAFFMGDINLEYLRESIIHEQNEATYVSLFRGQFLYCDLGKTFPTDVRLWSEYAPKDGAFTASVSVSSSGAVCKSASAKRVLRFAAAAPGELGGVLTPHLQKRLQELAQTLESKIYISIEASGQMCFALDSGKGFFRASSWDAAIMRKQFTDNTKIVADIADVLCAIAS